MNRIVLFGLISFFSLVGICLIGGPKEAKAFHGWQPCGCQGWHPWYGNGRCYSGSRCSGCYGPVSQCCAFSSCWSQSKCYGCYGSSGCHGAIYHSCHGCYGACTGCGGYYRAVIPMLVVPVESAPSIISPPIDYGSKNTAFKVPSIEEEASTVAGDSTVFIGDYVTSGSIVDQYIHEPR